MNEPEFELPKLNIEINPPRIDGLPERIVRLEPSLGLNPISKADELLKKQNPSEDTLDDELYKHFQPTDRPIGTRQK